MRGPSSCSSARATWHHARLDRFSGASSGSRGSRPELGISHAADGMSSKERRGGGVFGRRDRSYPTRRQRVAQTLRFTEMPAVEMLGSVDALPDGAVRSIDTTTVVRIGPYRKSQFQAALLGAIAA